MLLKKGTQVELRIRGEVMADQESEDNAVVIRCLLLHPSVGLEYWTFAMPQEIVSATATVKVIKT